MRVALVATSAQFPRLPLASTETDTPIAVAYPYPLWKREQFFSSRYLWWELPRIGGGSIRRLLRTLVAAIMSQRMALTSGTKLGPYEILAPLGAGGMGEVYRATDTRLGRDVALKILPESFAREADRLRRFEQEARAVAALNHPNILAVFDIGQNNEGQQSGSPFLVSELLEGESLRAVLDRGALPQRKTIEYGVQIAHGLAAAHEKGIVHRDL